MKISQYLRRHKKDDNTAYTLGGLVGVLAALILGVFSLTLFNSFLLGSSQFAAVISSVLVDLTNGDRQVNAIGGLRVSPVLTAAAQAKANDMAENNYFAHVSPMGKNSWYWFKQVGYNFTYAGENLAVDFSDSVDVSRAWMNSPTHRKNILDGNFTEIGIAVAQGVYQGRETTFAVQMFGKPAVRAAVVVPVRTELIPSEPTAPALATTQPSTATQEPVTTQVAGATATATPAVVEPEPKPKPKPTSAPAPAPSKPVAAATSTAVTASVDTQVRGLEADVAMAPIVPAASWMEHWLASPMTTLRYVYLALAVLILLLLAYVTELEFHQRHRHHLVATASLFVLMIGLFTLADVLLFAQPVIAAISN